MATNQDLSSGMEALRATYLTRLRERMSLLEEWHRKSGLDGLSEDDREALRAQAHKLSGSGATYGFPAISSAARELEECLIDNLSVEVKKLEPLIGQFVSACRQAQEAFERQQTTKTEDIKQAAQAESDKNPLLLVVDDDESVCDIIRQTMQKNTRIVTTDNAAEAVEIIRKDKPDLVLLDDALQNGPSGLQIMEDIRLDPTLNKTPVLMLTANKQADSIMRGLMSGAVDYITKPFDPVSLQQKLSLHLEARKKSVLIADDDENVRLLLSYKLQSLGCKIYTAQDGIEAIDIVEKHKPTLVVLDRIMPRMDGITVLQTMRARPELSKIPVIMLTAKRQEIDVLSGLKLGASDYIVKPFNPDEVLLRVARFMTTAK